MRGRRARGFGFGGMTGVPPASPGLRPDRGLPARSWGLIAARRGLRARLSFLRRCGRGLRARSLASRAGGHPARRDFTDTSLRTGFANCTIC